MTDNKKTMWILDAPGINGMGSNSLQKMQAHLEEGGSFLHEMVKDESGNWQFSKSIFPDSNLHPKLSG